MARRRGRRGGRRKAGIPLVQTATVLVPALSSLSANGLSVDGVTYAIYDTTGISVKNVRNSDWNKAILLGVALALESTIGRKVANRVGINKMLRKLTGGYVQLM